MYEILIQLIKGSRYTIDYHHRVSILLLFTLEIINFMLKVLTERKINLKIYTLIIRELYNLRFNKNIPT